MARRKTSQNKNKLSQKVNKPIAKKQKLQKASSENAEANQIQTDQRENKQGYQCKQQQNIDKIYDLDKGLVLEAKALRKYLKLSSVFDQSIPFMISVKALSSSEVVGFHQRQSLDLFCVIDVSGSMEGEKLKNLKETLLFLIDMLKESDRISLITFNDQAKILNNLLNINDNNKQNLTNLINSIESSGGTNIASGIKEAIDEIKKRKSKSENTSIFLLSDGQDNASYQVIQKLKIQNENFSLHTFGYGSDHDSILMEKIAKIKDGNFYYIEKMDEIDRYFVDALGGLFSVISKDLVLDIEIAGDQNFREFLSECTVSKTYGDMWNTLVKDKRYQIKLNSLRCGTGRDFIFEINFPKNKMASIQHIQRFVEIFKVSLTALSIQEEKKKVCFKETSLQLQLIYENEEINQQEFEIDENVEFHYLRVKAAESIQNALKYTQEQDYEKAKLILKETQEKLQKCSPNNIFKLQLINQELQDSYNKSDQKSYKCVPQMQYAQQWIYNQQGNPQEEDQYDSYQAEMQQTLQQRRKVNALQKQKQQNHSIMTDQVDQQLLYSDQQECQMEYEMSSGQLGEQNQSLSVQKDMKKSNIKKKVNPKKRQIKQKKRNN
ncbi:hypothetical protein ABPG74_022915 [Tetrahymena malaccensis]